MKKITSFLFFVALFIQTVQSQSVTSFTLVNSDTDNDLGPLTNGSIIYSGQNVNVRANVSAPVGSVLFYLDGSFVRSENAAPYAIGTDIAGDYNKWNLPSVGYHTLNAIPYSGNNGSGTAGTPLSIYFYVYNAAITFTLVDPATDSDVGPLNEGDIVSLGDFTTNKITVRANSTFPNTHSVYMSIVENAMSPVFSYSRYENDVPYSLFSDNSGDYNGQIVPAGNYILSATPYTDFNGGGSSGPARVVSFTLVNPPALKTQASIQTYPNPVDNNVTVDLGNQSSEYIDVTIADVSGREYYSGKLQTTNGSFNVDLIGKNMLPGIYVIKVNSDKESKTVKFIKN